MSTGIPDASYFRDEGFESSEITAHDRFILHLRILLPRKLLQAGH
jgi:hypothetical protein